MYKFENKTIPVVIGDRTFNVILRKMNYQNNGRFAIVGELDNGAYTEKFGVLSVNISSANLDDNEIIIKNWSENEQFAHAALISGYFRDTGRRITTGFVEAPVWLILEDSDGL